MNRLKIGSAFHTVKDIVNFSHIAIIASFFLIVSLDGCGYKTSPKWVQKANVVKTTEAK